MKIFKSLAKIFLLCSILFLMYSGNAFAAPGDTEIVSKNDNGTQGDYTSDFPSISADGRYVAFSSGAHNLVANLEYQTYLIYVFDRQKGTIEIVSVNDNGTQGNAYSENPSISVDGSFVAFSSRASNLVPNDTNGFSDIFVYDRIAHTIERVSIADNGAQSNSGSYHPVISADGRFVAYESYASNIVSNDTNGTLDVFLYDRKTHKVKRISVNDNGTEGNKRSEWPSITADGKFVAFQSNASNLVSNSVANANIYVYDRDTQKIEMISVSDNGTAGNNSSYTPSISLDGRFVTFSSYSSNLVTNNTNGFSDIFVYDRYAHTIERVSIADNGTEANNDSYLPKISADGNFVAFYSKASNLVPNDTNNSEDIFVYNRQNKIIKRVSVNSSGEEGDNNSNSPSISADGRFVAFESLASDLIDNDTNGTSDIFVHELSVTTSTDSPFDKMIINYDYVRTPILNTIPDFARPFAIGNLSGGTLNFAVGLNKFASPVDIYLAISLDKIKDKIFFINSSNGIQNSVTAWKTNQTAEITNENLFSNIKASQLPKGKYTLYTLAVPAGATNINKSYLWITSFDIK